MAAIRYSVPFDLFLKEPVDQTKFTHPEDVTVDAQRRVYYVHRDDYIALIENYPLTTADLLMRMPD